jgi:hypothetical protein
MWHHWHPYQFRRRGRSAWGFIFGLAFGAFAMGHHIKHRAIYGDKPHGHMRHWNFNHYNSQVEEPLTKMRQIVKEKANLSDE